MRRQHSIVVFLRLELPIDDRERERGGEGGEKAPLIHSNGLYEFFNNAVLFMQCNNHLPYGYADE